MKTVTGRERFLTAFQGGQLDRPPLWLMRQAGRYLPGYRSVRARSSFWEVCQTPELSTAVALEPLRLFPLDAAIVFSDILTVPLALGVPVTFDTGHGPQLGRQLRNTEDLQGWQLEGAIERLAFVSRAVRHLREAIGPQHALLGFAGAPWTLFAYMVQGRGSKDFQTARRMLQEQPALATQALTTLAGVVAELLEAQCEAGADAVQVFDSWGGLLTAEEYRRFALPALKLIADSLERRKRHSLLFVRGGPHLAASMQETGFSGISLDPAVPFGEAARLFPGKVLQGNLDPQLLLGSAEQVRAAADRMIEEMRAATGLRRCIANLGHGILPGTPVESVRAFCAAVIESGGELPPAARALAS